MDKIIVIGGGAAGMLAAGVAAQRGKKVLLVEKNEKLGKKLFITGKGRCNITNMCDVDDFLNKVVNNKNFLYSSLYTFDNYGIIDLIERYGVKTKVEQGNRVFPKSDKSSDVIKALLNFLKDNDVQIKLNKEVKDILCDNNKIVGVKVEGGKTIECDKVIIATGGMSYLSTGSTGDGYKFAKKLGHNIIDIRPALVPLKVKDEWVRKLQGLSLRNVNLKIKHNNKEIFNKFGEMIFTHFGISGPIVLEGSSYINKYIDKGNIYGYINLKPALTKEQLDKRLQRDFEKYSNKYFKNSLKELLPEKIIPVIVELSGINKDKLVNQITKQERNKLIDTLTNLSFKIQGTRPINEAIITSGGVDVKEINSSTMESKKIKDLYFVGEILDIDALTGGFNLQIAFSTGYLAGINV